MDAEEAGVEPTMSSTLTKLTQPSPLKFLLFGGVLFLRRPLDRIWGVNIDVSLLACWEGAIRTCSKLQKSIATTRATAA